MPFVDPTTETGSLCGPVSKPRKPIKIKSHFVLGGIFLVAIVGLVFISSFKTRATLAPVVFTQTVWGGGVYTGVTTNTSGWSKYENAQNISTDDADNLIAASIQLGVPGFLWENNGIPVAISSGSQTNPQLILEDSGESFIVWDDSRNGKQNIYAQKLNATGEPQWAENGVVVFAGDTETTMPNTYPQIISDGLGGVIIVWSTGGEIDIYAQKLNATGEPQWAENGVVVSAAVGSQYNPCIASDGSGGVIVAWMDTRVSSKTDIYVQRINSLGVLQWTENGVAIFVEEEVSSSMPKIVSDESGGAIITWSKSYWNEIGQLDEANVYAQRVNSSGVPQWTENGIVVSAANSYQLDPNIISVGSGETIIVWSDWRSGDNYDIYAQKVNASGVPQWTENGVAISAVAASHQHSPQIIADGSGGAIIAWQDARVFGYDIYAQKINSSGIVQWTENGVVASNTAPMNQTDPQISPDGSGGAIIVWRHDIHGYYDVNAQRLDSEGTARWTTDGVAITSLAWPSKKNAVWAKVASNNSGEAVITWADNRNNDGYSDIYAQKVRQGFSSSASLTSTIFDVGSTTAWDTLYWWADNIPAGTSIVVQIRTSDDNINWSPWSSEVNLTAGRESGEIAPPSGRYIQYRVNMETSDPASTPILQEITFSGTTNPYVYGSEDEGQITIDTDTIEGDSSDLINVSAGAITTTGSVNIGGTNITIGKAVQINVPGANLAITNTDFPEASIIIPNETIISGESDWDGTIVFPTNTSLATTPSGFRFGNVIVSVGSPNSVLIFDKPVLISVSNLTNQGVSSLRYKATGSNSWRQVSKCSGTFASPVMPNPYGECYVFDGVDTLNIWTYHFTIFADLLSLPSYSPQKETILEPTPEPSVPVPEQPAIPTTPTQPTIPTTPPTPPQSTIPPISASAVTENTLLEVLNSPLPTFPESWGVGFGAGRNVWAQEHRRAIYQAYIDNLSRNPTIAEVNWQLQNNPDIISIRYSMLVSPEFVSKWGVWRGW